MVRERVGGGGNVKFGLGAEWDCLLLVEFPCARLGARAGGGRLNVFSVTETGESLLPWISDEAAGVGGRLGRGMLFNKVEYLCGSINAGSMSHVGCLRGAQWACRASVLGGGRGMIVYR